MLWFFAWAIWGVSLLWSLTVVLRLWWTEEWRQRRFWRHLRSIALFGTFTLWMHALPFEWTRCPGPGGGVPEVELAFPVIATCDGGPNLTPLWLNSAIILFALCTVATVVGSILTRPDHRRRTPRPPWDPGLPPLRRPGTPTDPDPDPGGDRRRRGRSRGLRG
ncbi:hypothetical protein [Streptomyces sp. ST2-7A]|uniref:hypothetical protein n=1 Tax=Streptomyces sp. ST2-7A TaxID=2907214 RepID=UPI001F307B05|nr:hypothetical protein [Streptomyces sp. ST2-7A]MCE7080979.1 hypothetical protein [Streptomyces sp. ST2-7A]